MKYNLILDLDGTLYNFDGKEGGVFHSSNFYKDLRENMIAFIASRKDLDPLSAAEELGRLHKKYNGEISIGVQKEYGISTFEYFAETWSLDPDKYILKDEGIFSLLEKHKGSIALLTAAPSAWANLAIDHLGIKDLLEGRIYTGESLLRKPNPLIFQKIVDDSGLAPEQFISVGDQEYSDIIPAKSLGMKAVLIGRLEDSVADFQANNIYDAIDILRKEGLI